MLVAAGAGSGGGSAQDSTGWSQGGGGLPRHAHDLPLPLQDPMARDGREAAADARSGGGSGVVVARRWWAMPVIFFVCLPCVPQRSARQTWTRCSLAPSPSLTFCLSCVLINARQRFFTVPSGEDTVRKARTLPCKKVSCALCRAPRQKTHGKAFAVRFLVFVVRPRRTAKPVSRSEGCLCVYKEPMYILRE
jgi:hypothetical protein